MSNHTKILRRNIMQISLRQLNMLPLLSKRETILKGKKMFIQVLCTVQNLSPGWCAVPDVSPQGPVTLAQRHGDYLQCTECAIGKDQDFSNNFNSGKRMGNMAVRANTKHGVLVAGLRTSCLGGGIRSWLAHLIASGSAFWRNPPSPLSSTASYEKSFGKDAFSWEPHRTS